MSHYRIPLSYNPPDAGALAEVLRRYEGKHHSIIIRDFEEAIAGLTGARYVVALNSGTAAIHLGLIGLGVKAGDEVLVSDFTYVASINPILYLGARPVFIDSEPETWNMDPDLLEKAIRVCAERGVTPKAIIVVHVYGMPAKMDAIKAVADRYCIPILEDAAEALGATVHDRHVGVAGEAGVFSFNNNKIITTYGGGVLVTDREDIYKKALLLAGQAVENMPYYVHKEVGYTYRMGPINAAVGLSQLTGLEERIRQRQGVFTKYRRALEPLGATFLDGPEGYATNRWLTTLVWKEGVDVFALSERLKKEGIEARLLWRPMHRQDVFNGYDVVTNGVAMYLFENGLSLPSGIPADHGDAAEVIDKIMRAVNV